MRRVQGAFDAGTDLADRHGGELRTLSEAETASAIPSRPDARTPVPLQPGLCRLRKDPVPGLTSCAVSSRPSSVSTPWPNVLLRSSRFRAANPSCTHGCRRSSRVSSNGANTSISARTRSLLREKIEAGDYRPSKYLTFSVHMDGSRDEHDYAVCREGVFDVAIDAIRLAVGRGFRVNDQHHTLFDGADPEAVRRSSSTR